jgi:uncharacterized protein (DUF4213/DUF364 family)
VSLKVIGRSWKLFLSSSLLSFSKGTFIDSLSKLSFMAISHKLAMLIKLVALSDSIAFRALAERALSPLRNQIST